MAQRYKIRRDIVPAIYDDAELAPACSLIRCREFMRRSRAHLCVSAQSTEFEDVRDA